MGPSMSFICLSSKLGRSAVARPEKERTHSFILPLPLQGRKGGGRSHAFWTKGFWPAVPCGSDGSGTGLEEMVPSFPEKAPCILGQLC